MTQPGTEANGAGTPARDRAVKRSRWLCAVAAVWGVVPVIVALTVHHHGSASDPSCIHHCYTLVQTAGVGVLAFVAAPSLLALLVVVLVTAWVARPRRGLMRVAWGLAIISCLVCFVGLTSVGVAMIPAGPLTVFGVLVSPGG